VQSPANRFTAKLKRESLSAAGKLNASTVAQISPAMAAPSGTEMRTESLCATIDRVSPRTRPTVNSEELSVSMNFRAFAIIFRTSVAVPNTADSSQATGSSAV
jgi:hypothetical protein